MTFRAMFAVSCLTLLSYPALAEDPPLADPQDGSDVEETPEEETPEEQAEPTGDGPHEDDEERQWACSSERMKEVLELAEKRLVRVEGRMGDALGFVFHDERHVLTTDTGVGWAESLRVILPGGKSTTVRVVARHAETNLAILELDRGAEIAPMERRDGPIQVGDPVFAVGSTSYFRGGDTTIHAGVVNSHSEKKFTTNALEDAFHHDGGPIFDCEGKLVGIATGGWGKDVTPIARAMALTEAIGVQEIYTGPVVRPHFELGLPVQLNEHAAGAGVTLGLGLVIDDWLELKLKGGLVALGEIGTENMGARAWVQTLGGPRLFFDADRDLSLNVAIGTTLAYERFCDEACSEHEPPIFEDTRLLPTAEIGFQFWPGMVSYQFQLDTDDHRRSIHQITLGLDF